MTQSPMAYSPSSLVGLNPLVSSGLVAAPSAEPLTTASQSLFLDHLMEAATSNLRPDEQLQNAFSLFTEKVLEKNASPNYVVRRDLAGRPTVWKIHGMTRKITYLASGKIKSFEDTGKLPVLATANREKAYLLDFETYDNGKTYIGRLMVNEETDSIVMTDLYLRNDGTVVATDDSGFEMTWNPNNGDTSTEFRQHNHQRESWTDHLDGTVTIEMNCDNATFIRMNGTCEKEFHASNILIKASAGSFELQASGREKVCRTLVDPQGWSEVKIISRDMKQISRSLMQANAVEIVWKKCGNTETPTAVVTCNDEELLNCLNNDI